MLSDRDIELRLKELQAVGLFTCLCFLGAVIDLILMFRANRRHCVQK
jgi:hypothetical protein